MMEVGILNMQIDSITAKQLITLQENATIQDKSALIQSMLNNNVGGSDFDVMLKQVMSTTSELSATDSSVSLNAGVSWSDGLLWQQLGAVSKTTSTNTEHSTYSGKSLPSSYNDLIEQASRKYGVPESLIKAVIDTESSFNPGVVSSAGAKGLMQLMDGTAQGLGVSDSFDPAQNIDAGTKYLSYQLKRFNGQEKMALAAYNAGPGRVSRLGVSSDAELMNNINSLPEETRKYISKVQNARSKYEEV